MYIVAGALHTISDLDVSSVRRETIVSLVDNHANGEPEEGVAAGHHCHGCFSVSLPAFMLALTELEVGRSLVITPNLVHGDRASGIDPPPPKSLT